MRVKLSNLWLAPGGIEGTVGARWNGTQINDEAVFFAADSASHFARGGRKNGLTFGVHRLFSSEAAAIRFATLHFSQIPAQATLSLFADESADGVPDAQLLEAVLESFNVQRLVGCSVFVEYSFLGGLYTTEDLELPTEDDDVKRDVADLVEGSEFIDIEFATVFGGLSPVIGTLTLEVPDGHPSFEVTVRNVTTGGFRAFFQGNAVPAPGYKLHWSALQRS